MGQLSSLSSTTARPEAIVSASKGSPAQMILDLKPSPGLLVESKSTGCLSLWNLVSDHFMSRNLKRRGSPLELL